MVELILVVYEKQGVYSCPTAVFACSCERRIETVSYPPIDTVALSFQGKGVKNKLIIAYTRKYQNGVPFLFAGQNVREVAMSV